MHGPARGDRDRKGPPPAGANSVWEWVVAALGAVLVLASIAYLSWLQLAGDADDVEPALRVVAIERQGDRHRVLLQVTNTGHGAAAALRVTGRLSRGGEVLEQAQTEFDYLAGRSSREAGLFFQRDPRAFELHLSAESYQKP